MYDIRFGGKGNLAQVFDDPVCLMTNLQIFCRESSFANLKIYNILVYIIYNTDKIIIVRNSSYK